MPQGYLPWESFKKNVSVIRTLKNTNKIYSASNNFHQTALTENYPVYCLRESLLSEIRQTDVGENVPLFLNVNLPLPGFIVFFPRKTIKSACSKGYVEYCIFNCQPQNGELKYVFSWTSLDSEKTLFLSSKNIRNNGTLLKSQVIEKNPEIIKNSFLLRNIILQTLLLIQYPTETVITEAKDTGKGFQPQKPASDSYLYPRWIGEEKKYITRTSKTDSSASGSIKSSHWRRGHWRLAKVGAGRKEERPTWVRHTKIN